MGRSYGSLAMMTRLPEGDASRNEPADGHSSKVIEFLQATEVFGSLSRSDLEDLVPYLELVHLGAGETVVRQGEPAESLYVIGLGRLEMVIDVEGGERLVGEAGPGQIVGEAALVTGGVRSATCRCLRDSLLLRLAGSQFSGYLRTRPDVLLRLTGELVTRAATARTAPPPTSPVRTIAVVPAGARARPIGDFAAELTEALNSIGPTLRVSSDLVDRALGDGAAATGLDDPRNSELLGWLQSAEDQHVFVVYEAHAEPSPWTERCLRQADRVLLVAEAGADFRLGPVEATLLAPGGPSGRTVSELVLVRSPGTLPSGTLPWLERRPLRAHHHLRAGDRRDRDRLARFLAGEAIGLVLSGGGARGAIHLGVIRAFEEAGVPIDAVGGSSIGAIMGATYAMGWDDARRTEIIRNGYGAGWVREATLPVVSLLRGRRLTETLRAAFGEVTIEDLPIEYLCVSTNLTRGEVVVHRQGPVWRAIRASSSIPGVFSPICADGDLLVDGGVLSHLPIRPVRERVGHGRIVAVDLRRDVDLSVHEDFGPCLSGWQVLKERLRPGRPQASRPPSIGALLLRSAELGTALEERSSLASTVELRLRPPTGRYALMDFNTSAADALFEAGYAYTKAELNRTGMGDVLARPRRSGGHPRPAGRSPR